MLTGWGESPVGLKAQQRPSFRFWSLAFILVANGNHLRVSNKVVFYFKSHLAHNRGQKATITAVIQS